jgi:hypothetical protein
MGFMNFSPTHDITALYLTILGREPDAGGLEYWTNQLNSGVPLDQIEQAISSSQEAQTYKQNTPLTQEQFVAQNPVSQYG